MSLVSYIPGYFVLFVAIVNGSLLMIWLSVCCWCIGMLVTFEHLLFYPETLLKLLISFRSFGAEAMGSSRNTIMSSANRDNLASSFPILIPFIYFSCLIAVARISNTMLNRNGERGHPYLLPVFKGDASSFFPILYDTGCGFIINTFYYFEIRSINT